MSLKRVGELEIEEDMRFHRRSWVFQRAGWIAMLLVIAAALAGLLGSGPLSSGTVTAGNGALAVEYDRFARHFASTRVRVLLSQPGAEHQARIGLSTAFLDAVQIESIMPTPDRVESGAEQSVFIFTLAAGQPASVTFHLKTQRIGRASARVSLVDGPSLTFEQFVYP